MKQSNSMDNVNGKGLELGLFCVTLKDGFEK